MGDSQKADGRFQYAAPHKHGLKNRGIAYKYQENKNCGYSRNLSLNYMLYIYPHVSAKRLYQHHDNNVILYCLISIPFQREILALSRKELPEQYAVRQGQKAAAHAEYLMLGESI